MNEVNEMTKDVQQEMPSLPEVQEITAEYNKRCVERLCQFH